jgi:hypothetical protein
VRSGISRHEFSTAVTAALAKRASYICSRPGCRALTVFPSGKPKVTQQRFAGGMCFDRRGESFIRVNKLNKLVQPRRAGFRWLWTLSWVVLMSSTCRSICLQCCNYLRDNTGPGKTFFLAATISVLYSRNCHRNCSRAFFTYSDLES